MNAELHWRKETLHRQPRPGDTRLERWAVYRIQHWEWTICNKIVPIPKYSWIAEFQERVSTSHQWHLIRQWTYDTHKKAYALANYYKEFKWTS